MTWSRIWKSRISLPGNQMSYFNVSFAAAGGVEGISYICYFIPSSLLSGHDALAVATVTTVTTSIFFLRDHH